MMPKIAVKILFPDISQTTNHKTSSDPVGGADRRWPFLSVLIGSDTRAARGGAADRGAGIWPPRGH